MFPMFGSALQAVLQNTFLKTFVDVPLGFLQRSKYALRFLSLRLLQTLLKMLCEAWYGKAISRQGRVLLH